jgi:hypothetical protein|tara:strand:+ start:2268 stop:2609 length:342 start_codon:yes stop_codon:yes gene_type:complete
MKTITLHSFEEKRPPHDALIAWFCVDSMGFCGIKCGDVEYFWDDKEGNSISYDADDDLADMTEQGYFLNFTVNDEYVEHPTDYWIEAVEAYAGEADVDARQSGNQCPPIQTRG